MNPTELQNKIDNNGNNLIEEKEIITFINSEKNLKELGTYLTNRNLRRSDTIYRITHDVINKHHTTIESKVKQNQPLSSSEKALMTLSYVLTKKTYPSHELLVQHYIGTTYGNLFYHPITLAPQ